MAVRKVSRRGQHSRNADEIGRRSDGDWPDLQGSAAEGHSLAGAKYSVARSVGNAGFAAAGEIGDAPTRPHPLAVDGHGPRTSSARNLRADEERNVVLSAPSKPDPR